MATLVLAGPVAAAHASSAAVAREAVAALNAVRTQMGEPTVVEAQNLDADCTVHAHWMAQNHVISHPEPSNVPGSTTLGSETGQSSVLSYAEGGVPQTSVSTIHWLHGSPLHLLQLLAPGLQATGYDFESGYACMVTDNIDADKTVTVFDGSRGAGHVYSWPTSGATGVPISEDTSDEEPSPNTETGLPQGQVTGPWLLFYAPNSSTQTQACLGTRYTAFSITGPKGALPVHKIDEGDMRTNADIANSDDDACLYPFGGGLIVANKPLNPSTKYTASITYENNGTDPGTPQTYTWSFTTETLEQATPRPTIYFTGGTLSSSSSGKRSYTLRFAVKNGAHCTAKVAGARVKCSIRRGVIQLAGARHGRNQLSVLVTVTDRWGRKASLRRNFR